MHIRISDKYIRICITVFFMMFESQHNLKVYKIRICETVITSLTVNTTVPSGLMLERRSWNGGNMAVL